MIRLKESAKLECCDSLDPFSEGINFTVRLPNIGRHILRSSDEVKVLILMSIIIKICNLTISHSSINIKI